MRTAIVTAALLALFGLSTVATAGDLYGRATAQTKIRQAQQMQEAARIKAIQDRALAEVEAMKGTSGWETRAASPGKRRSK